MLPVGSLDLGDLTATLVAAGIDTVWPGRWGTATPVDLTAACEAAGLAVVGPASAALRSLASRELLAEAVAASGLSVFAGGDTEELRVIEADVLADAHGVTWSLGLRETTICHHGHLLLAESPAPYLPGELEPGLQAAAARPGRLGRVRRRRRRPLPRRPVRPAGLAGVRGPGGAPRARSGRGVHRGELRRSPAAGGPRGAPGPGPADRRRLGRRGPAAGPGPGAGPRPVLAAGWRC